jgi:hypothetical protein
MFEIRGDTEGATEEFLIEAKGRLMTNLSRKSRFYTPFLGELHEDYERLVSAM